MLCPDGIHKSRLGGSVPVDGPTRRTIKGYKPDEMFNFTRTVEGHVHIIRRIQRILISVSLEDHIGARKSSLTAVSRVKVYWHRYYRVVAHREKSISKINKGKNKSLDDGKSR